MGLGFSTVKGTDCGAGKWTSPSSAEPASPHISSTSRCRSLLPSPWQGSPSRGLKLLQVKWPYPCSQGKEMCDRTVPAWKKQAESLSAHKR